MVMMIWIAVDCNCFGLSACSNSSKDNGAGIQLTFFIAMMSEFNVNVTDMTKIGIVLNEKRLKTDNVIADMSQW